GPAAGAPVARGAVHVGTSSGGGAAMRGWLLAQLPQAMANDRVIGGFVHGCEEMADSVRDRVSTVEHALDVDLASPEMLSFVAAWLGVPRDTSGAGGPAAREAQRKLIGAVGQVRGWRGTRGGVETLLEALPGGGGEVSDSGGVFGRH